MRLWPLAAALLATVAAPITAPIAAQGPAPAPVSQLVQTVNIPYETFTLANGLRVIVSTDRKAPVVAVSVWYDVGSKHEPKGKTGEGKRAELVHRMSMRTRRQTCKICIPFEQRTPHNRCSVPA